MIASTVHLPVLKNIPDVAVGWVADVDGALADEVGKAYGVASVAIDLSRAILPACDVALLAVPVHARGGWIRYFAHRQVPLLVEKPFALDEAEHQEYLRLFGDTPVACGYVRRSYAAVRSLQRIVADQWFGELQRIRYSEGNRTAKTGLSSPTLDLSYRRGGGVLRDVGCHGIDALLHITGAGGFHVSEATIAWDGETDRKVRSRFELQLPAQTRHGTCSVEFVVSWISDEGNELVLDFETASVSCGPGPASGLSVRLSGNPEDIALSLGVRGARTSYQAFYLEWEDFLAATQEWRPGQFAAASSLLTTRLVDAIYRAGGAAA